MDTLLDPDKTNLLLVEVQEGVHDVLEDRVPKEGIAINGKLSTKIL